MDAIEVAVLAYDGMTALDAVGPAQVLAAVPGVRLRWVAATPGARRTDCGMAVVADHALAAVPFPDVVLVPGGVDVRPVARDEPVLAWLRSAHARTRWTTSVCTGALVLAAAGLLRGVRATTHWLALDALARHGAVPVRERVVEDGKVMTAAGVSAGIDMALRLAERLAGRDAAEAAQLAIEYDPDPPFTAGSPRTARPAIVARARRALTGSRGDA